MVFAAINIAQGRRAFAVRLLMAALAFISTIKGLVIEVSQTSGRNDPNCLKLSNHSQPCRTLTYALKAVNNFTPNDARLRIEFLDDIYHLKERVEIHFNESHQGGSLTITAGSNRSQVILTCLDHSTAGINIKRAQHVHFVNLLFKKCGPKLAAVVTVWGSSDVTFQNCIFRDNTMAGLNAFESSVTVEDCLFQNNTSNFFANPEGSYILGEGSAAGGAAFVFRHAKNASVLVRRTVFKKNSAVFNDIEYFIAPSANVSDFSKGGGGLLVSFLGTTEDCEVTLDETHFYHNQATYGGGIYVAAVNRVRNNRFAVSNSEIRRNSAGQAGGGVIFSQWDKSTDISMSLRNCTIENNWSRRGAGMNVFYMNFVDRSNHSSLVIDSVRFRRNRGSSSNAIRFSSALPFGNPITAVPEIINCNFSDHVAGTVSYTAPLTSQRVSLIFKGINVFENNLGSGAVELENSNIHVNGSVQFINNTGKRGGALAMMASQIKMYAGSEMLFMKNHAELIGGAIAVSTHMMDEVIHMYNTDCFLTYQPSTTRPSDWQTKISFIGNSAKVKGAAIYVASLDACLWDEQYPYYSWHRSLRWNNTTFVYRGNYLQSSSGSPRRSGHEYDIATDTSRFEAGEAAVKLAPGEHVMLHVQGLDQLNHSVYTVASVLQTNQESPLQFKSDSMHTLSPFTNGTLPLSYEVASPEVFHKLNYSIRYQVRVADFYSTLTNEYMFSIQPKWCPPGFKFRGTKCVCDTKIDGVLRCEEGRTVFLEEGYWAGVENKALITYYCPFSYCNCTKHDNIPGCKVDPFRMDDQCAFGRTGKLCGSCSRNLSVGLRWEQCIDDSECSAWVVVAVVVIVTLLTVLVIWLNPSLSSELRGPLFFFQVLPFVIPPSNEVWGVVIFFANMFNFGGPLVYITRTCVARGMNNLYMVAIGYLMPLLVMVIFLVSYILSMKNVVRLKFRAHSSLHSFWLIILFTYHYLVETTFFLLHCPKAGQDYVFFYDGNIKCFEDQHRAMGALALVVLLMFVIPPPIIVILLTKGVWKVDPQYASALTNGLRPQCQWWWAFDLSRRVLLVAVNVFIPSYKIRQVVMSLMCLLIFAAHSNMQPYKKARVNYTESFYLLSLCTLAILLVLKDWADGFLGILLLVLSCHSFFLLLFKAYRFFRKRFDCLATSRDFTRPRRYGTADSDGLEKRLDPEVRTRRDILETIFNDSSEGGLENESSDNVK